MTVVILSKNSANLIPCVRAVRQHEPEAWIVAVDDGLPPGTWTQLGGTVQEVLGKQPFVFARNANLGIAAARREDVLLLNDDALLRTPGGFSVLAAAAAAHPEYGVIASTCNNVGNTNQHPRGIGLREEPRMVCFVAVLLPRRTLDAVGPLDERYAAGYGCEDDDLCVRIRQAGLKIGIHDGCYVDHASLTSSFRGPAGAGGDYRPNLELFKAKWGADNWHV
jgi:GT2 family glycosyltransferase